MAERKSGRIVADRVEKTYGSGTSAVAALRCVSFAIEPGECIGILGKSGSGKSTLMNLIGGLDVPTAGRLSVAGQPLDAITRKQLADFRLQSIGFVFQSFHLIANQTVQENVELPLMLAGVPRPERRRQAREMLDAVGLSARLAHRPAQLSGGERQRTAIARALINQPAVLLADEPTGNLDSANAAAVMELMLDRVRRIGTTLLLVTHDRELASRTTSRLLEMQDGQLLA